MCGRFVLRASGQQVAKRWGLPPAVDWSPRYNIAPTQQIPVVRQGPEGKPEIVLMRWGLVPSWSQGAESGPLAINARAETVDQTPHFRHAFAHRRCLIPADGFYEWKSLSRHSQPYLVHLPGHELFAMAGVWDQWVSPQGEKLLSCAILTVPSWGSVRDLHPRMPLVLAEKDHQRWLAAPADDPQLGQLLVAKDFPWQVYPVSPAVNRPDAEGPELIRPWTSPRQLEFWGHLK